MRGAAGFAIVARMETENEVTRRPRRRFSAEEKARVIGQYEQSGLTRVEFCHREGVSLFNLQRWLGERRQSGEARFVDWMPMPMRSASSWPTMGEASMRLRLRNAGTTASRTCVRARTRSARTSASRANRALGPVSSSRCRGMDAAPAEIKRDRATCPAPAAPRRRRSRSRAPGSRRAPRPALRARGRGPGRQRGGSGEPGRRDSSPTW